MDQKEMLAKLKAINSAIEDYLDKVDMSEADEEPKKSCKDKKEEK